MGNEINNVTATSAFSSNGKTKVVTIKKTDASGQVYTMSATIFDRNKKSNQEKPDAVPGKMIVDSQDAIHFEGDFEHIKAKDVAKVSRLIFEGYDEGEYDGPATPDLQPEKNGNNQGVNDITLNTGKKDINLGAFKSALEELGGSQGIQAPAGGSRPAVEGGTPQYMPPQFGNMTMPDIRGISNIMQEAGYRAMMLSPDASAMPYIMGADTDAALNRIFGGLLGDLKTLMPGFGGGYSPSFGSSGSTSGSDSGSNSVDDTTAKKAKDAEEAAKKAEEAAKKAREEKLKEANKKREEEVSGILKDLYGSMDGAGTNNEKLEKAVKLINKDNVLEVLEAWEKDPRAKAMGETSLIKLIVSETEGTANVESLLHPFSSTSKKYVQPIQDALVARSGSSEAKAISDVIDHEATGSLTNYYRKAGVEMTEDLYKQVQKEQKDDKIKDPLVVQIDENIAKDNKEKAEQAKAKAEAAKAEAKAKVESEKAEQTADQAKIDAALAEAKSKAGKKGLNQKTKDAVLAKVKADLTAEKAEKLRIEKAEKEAFVQAQREAAKDKNEAKTKAQEVKTSNEEAKKELDASKVHNEDTTPWWHFWGKTAPKVTRDKDVPAVVKAAKEEPKAEAAAPAATTTVTAPEKDKQIADLKKEYIRLGALMKQYEGKDMTKYNQASGEQSNAFEELKKLGVTQSEINKL